LCGGNIAMSIKRPVKIIWIDDDIDHKEDAKNIESRRKNLKIIFITPFEFEKILEEESDVDLFLVDDRLLSRRRKPLPALFKRHGLSVAAQIREKFPEIPIYLFSAYKEGIGIYTTLAEAAESLADDIFDFKTIQRKGHNILYYDALDYRRIRESPRESVDSLLNLLNAPEIDHEKIVSALPESLKNGLSPITEKERALGNAIAFGKWTKRIFLKLPGFVYNSLYAATKLGITEETFIELSREFENARYNGIFAKTSCKLWWDSKLREIIFELAAERIPDDETTDLRVLTKKIFSLDDSKISRCIVCGDKYPETIGINKDDENDYQPVHYRCSEPHPKKTRLLYFEEPRQFSKEK